MITKGDISGEATSTWTMYSEVPVSWSSSIHVESMYRTDRAWKISCNLTQLTAINMIRVYSAHGWMALRSEAIVKLAKRFIQTVA